MTAVFQQVIILFSFSALGFFLAKRNMINTQHTPILSALLVRIFMPFNVFRTFSSNFNRDYISKNYELLLYSAAIVLVLVTTMSFVSRFFDKRRYERSVYEYSLIVPNCGYMGYPMAEAVLGQTGLLNAMMFCLPLLCYIYTISYSNLTKRGISFKKLFNPTMVAMLLGAITGLTQIEMPFVLSSVLSKASACMGPVSMLLAGMVITEFNFKELLSSKKIYIVTALRLLIVPILIGFILTPFSKSTAEVAVLIYAMPCGLNTIVFPRLVGEDCRIGAGLALLSNVLACITIPIVTTLFHIGG